jgi:hypothetical protein
LGRINISSHTEPHRDLEMPLDLERLRGSAVGMKPLLYLLSCGALATASLAAEMKISGPQIREQLADRTFQQVKPATDHKIEQTFQRGGVTVYVVDGQVQLGQWKVEGDTYCSAWPPSDDWDCYDILQDKTALVFVSARGVRYVMLPATP